MANQEIVDEFRVTTVMRCQIVRRLASFHPLGKVRAELVEPAPDGFVADHHAALEQQLLDMPQAQLKPEMLVHCATDDGTWKTMTAVNRL